MDCSGGGNKHSGVAIGDGRVDRSSDAIKLSSFGDGKLSGTNDIGGTTNQATRLHQLPRVTQQAVVCTGVALRAAGEKTSPLLRQR